MDRFPLGLRVKIRGTFTQLKIRKITGMWCDFLDNRVPFGQILINLEVT